MIGFYLVCKYNGLSCTFSGPPGTAGLLQTAHQGPGCDMCVVQNTSHQRVVKRPHYTRCTHNPYARSGHFACVHTELTSSRRLRPLRTALSLSQYDKSHPLKKYEKAMEKLSKWLFSAVFQWSNLFRLKKIIKNILYFMHRTKQNLSKTIFCMLGLVFY